MISPNSNCSRVDAVKAAANRIEILSSATNSNPAPATPANDSARKVKSDLQTLDRQVKSGDANAAEIALAVAKKDLETAQTAVQPQSPGRDPRSLDVYA
jgi:hypothetical protein